jgi:hypothetical protein
MNVPKVYQDVWVKATAGDKLKALALLGSLPGRQAISPEIEDASFDLALSSVTRYGLEEAVRAILRGALGHAFFPSPPELRMQCDQAMSWHETRRRIAEREERNRRDLPARRAPITHEARARAAQILADFHKTSERAKQEETFVLDPSLVAQIPDNPKTVARRAGE